MHATLPSGEYQNPITFVHATTVIQAPALDKLHITISRPRSNAMANETTLNQIVKGAPTTRITPPPPEPLPPLASGEKYTPDSALSNLPSSPLQIYLNLLILESSLRSQYLHLLSRRRLNTFFLLLLAAWNSFFIYALFLRPREDGQGLGGSVYWVVETVEKLAFMGGMMTSLLVWATGQWERGIRWPRRWIGTTNRGLRGFNLRVVIAKGKWWREMLGHMAFLFPFGLWTEGPGSDWHHVEHEQGVVIEEDLAKGGDHIMLLLLPKSFSPEFRENWEEYRTEYWDKENERRAGLRGKMKAQRRAKAKETGGWKWWTGGWRLIPHYQARRHHDLEKHPHGHPHTQHRQHLAEKDTKANRRRSIMRSESNSRQSSRSSTPVLADFDGVSEKPSAERVRRGSSVSSTASVRKKRDKRDGGAGLGLSPLTMSDEKPKRKSKHDKDRPETPGSDSGSGRNGSVA